jgi:hypothetical protein
MNQVLLSQKSTEVSANWLFGTDDMSMEATDCQGNYPGK